MTLRFVLFIFNRNDEYFIRSLFNICHDVELNMESQGGEMFCAGLHVLDMMVCGCSVPSPSYNYTTVAVMMK